MASARARNSGSGCCSHRSKESSKRSRGAAHESTKVGIAPVPLWPNAIRWFQSEHIDERKTSRGILAEKLQSEEIGMVLPDARVLIHEVARSNFDALTGRQRRAGITFDETGEVALKPYEPRQNRRDRGRSRGLVQNQAACPCARLGGSCKDESEEPGYRFAWHVFAEPPIDPVEQRKSAGGVRQSVRGTRPLRGP